MVTYMASFFLMSFYLTFRSLLEKIRSRRIEWDRPSVKQHSFKKMKSVKLLQATFRFIW